MSDIISGQGGVQANADRVAKTPGSGVSVAYFRGTMPAFADPQRYVDAEIEMYLQMSDQSMPLDRWGEYRNYGQCLYTAHFLVLSAREQQASEAGGIPGSPGTGMVTSKSVGGASISYDLSMGSEAGGGFWNQTTFGQRWYHLARLVGMGGYQSGGPDILLGPTFGPAWQGVRYWGY